MTEQNNVIHIDFAKPRRKPVDAISESLAEFRIAALRSEKLAEELEKLEREIDAMLRDYPRGAL